MEELNQKYHYFVQMQSLDSANGFMPFCFPGVYNKWEDSETKQSFEGFILFHCDADGDHFMEKINSGSHKYAGRMPCILPPDQYYEWLNPDMDVEEVEAYLYAFDGETMSAYSIAQQISKKGIDHNKPETLLFHPYQALGDENKFNFR